MVLANSLTKPPAQFTHPDGTLTKEAWRFLFSLNSNSSQAAAGTVTTDPGSGLAGGGAVSDGISLLIANNGVTNAMLRQGAGTSVLGRFAGSAGNEADIVATANFRVLTRESDQLAFRDTLNGVSVGSSTAAPLVRTEEFRIDQAPISETVTCTHTITISVNGTDYKIPIVAA